eukprot:1741726-Amphidinium_carterae.1
MGGGFVKWLEKRSASQFSTLGCWTALFSQFMLLPSSPMHPLQSYIPQAFLEFCMCDSSSVRLRSRLLSTIAIYPHHHHHRRHHHDIMVSTQNRPT